MSQSATSQPDASLPAVSQPDASVSDTSQPDFANSNFLIYSMFQTVNRIGGSLLVDCALTEEEAKKKVLTLEENHTIFSQNYPTLEEGTRRIVYIANNPEWWSSRR
jgi:hypothetical protein